MNQRANILARLRRWKSGASHYVVWLFAVAYVSAGVAPCAAAAGRATGDVDAAVGEHAESAHAGHAERTHRDPVAAPHHGHEAQGAPASDDTAPAPSDGGGEHCPHCPPGFERGAAIAHDDDHSSCSTLEDLTNVAASHAKDAPQPLVPFVGLAAFTLPPPLASPLAPPPFRAARTPSVPLNIRHCVFLI
ncbi:MAG: hypothetical protein EHM50_09695 [Lysobacterales bacterium]|nr:MAG: hypothetical protein EHM50_09695 [Xanthomonadales bacterium]